MWTELTPDALLAALSESESGAIACAATAATQQDVLGDIALNVSNEWRGALRKIMRVDRRGGYVPDELTVHILADYRYRAFTRLPNMGSLLDPLRVEEWRRANLVRDNLAKMAIQPPDEGFAEDTAPGARPAIADPDEGRILG